MVGSSTSLQHVPENRLHQKVERRIPEAEYLPLQYQSLSYVIAHSIIFVALVPLAMFLLLRGKFYPSQLLPVMTVAYCFFGILTVRSHHQCEGFQHMPRL
eukprot:GHVQ01012656.1.p3 GENE.GHVQ01012656.1~~GHVQ01012656.1.p3  ORF type:complete len:100 (-),score=1.71 GHVQ01012656.1:766-1065(-)